MNVEHEIESLLNSGLRFTIETNGHHVVVRVGDYLRQARPDATVDTVEQAVEWLRRRIGPQSVH